MSTAVEMAQELARVTEEQKNARKELFNQFVEQIFVDFPNLNRVVVQGYTPGFNDGDPCTHSHEVYVGLEEFADLPDYDEEDEEDSPIEYRNGSGYALREGTDGFLFNSDMPHEEVDQVKDAFGAFDEAIMDIFVTDFTLTWTRDREDAAKVGFEKDYYDCGF